MKKIFTLILAVIAAVTTVKAQFEVGGIVGGMNGASAKYWLNDKMALQADLAVGLTAAPTGIYYKGNKLGEGQMDHFDFMLNPNFLYHFDLPANFKVYAGGGLGLGLMGPLATYGYGTTVLGKFIINAIGGVSYDLPSIPLVLACDFRPGYGLGFMGGDDAHYSMFDWKLAFAVRYKL